MTWWRRHNRVDRAELAEAQRARERSAETLSSARDAYRSTLKLAALAKSTNTRNHFSERLNEAFGG